MAITYADIASTVALALSLVALYQNGSHRTRNLRVKAEADIVMLRENLAVADTRISAALNLAIATLNARGMYKSGLSQEKIREADALRLRAVQIASEVDAIKIPRTPLLSGFQIDGCVMKVATVMTRWVALSADIEGMLLAAEDSWANVKRR